MKKTKLEIETRGFACPNQMCGKVFLVPLTVENLSSKQAVPYSACPFCLTEVSSKEPSDQLEPNDSAEIPTPKIKQEVVRKLGEEPEEPRLEEGLVCPYEFGYLGKRSKNEGIPEECMTCEKIVQCMLDKIKG